MTTAQLAPTPIFKAFDNNGIPLANGLLYTYAAGTSSPQASYPSSSEATPNTNPIVLNARGECALWFDPTLSYKINLTDQYGNQIPGYPVDNIQGSITGLQSLVPAVTNTYNLGSSLLTWANVYVGTQLYINGMPILTNGNVGYYGVTAIETANSITPTNYFYPPGNFYRYGAKGGGFRISDGTISASSAIVTSPSGGFANAVAGMTCVVVDGGPIRSGGRPAPLITTIASVQSNTQVTLSAPVTQASTITMTGTLNSDESITSTSVNPITTGVGLVRTWTITGIDIPASTLVTGTTSSTLTISNAATGSGAQTLTLTATTEICYGWDDTTAIQTVALLPYPTQPVVDTFLMTQPLSLGLTGCNDFVMPPGSLLIFAIGNNTSSCVTATGYDRGNIPLYTGARYLPFKIDIAEIDCCNTGLDGFALQPSAFSTVRARVSNPFRSALSEWLTTAGSWQEGNIVDINCAHVGLHFHHKVNKATSTFQNLASYRIQGRAPGLNSVYLGINASTEADQCGGAIRMYAGGGAGGADDGINQNLWGAIGSCEFDGERTLALSYGSDICNSAVTMVDSSGSYVIEGAAAAYYSNLYYTNVFLAANVEDITEGSDSRGGYAFYAMANTLHQSNTILSLALGNWGQGDISPLWFSGTDNLSRYLGTINYAGNLFVTGPGAANYAGTSIESATATPPGPPSINGNLSNTVPITGTYTTIIAGDFNLMFFCKDNTTGGGAVGFMTTDTTTVTVISTTLTDIAFQRDAGVGLQAHTTGGTADRTLAVMAFAVG